MSPRAGAVQLNQDQARALAYWCGLCDVSMPQGYQLTLTMTTRGDVRAEVLGHPVEVGARGAGEVRLQQDGHVVTKDGVTVRLGPESVPR